MSIPVMAPGERGEEATQDVAALLGAIAALPSIEPFGTDNPSLAGLPPLIDFPPPQPEPPSQLGVVRGVHDGAIAALAVVKRLEDATAACKAALLGRLMGAVEVERVLVDLDRNQSSLAQSSAVLEAALVLGIPERTAAALTHHCVEVLKHPVTFKALQAGVLSWRHACTIADEITTVKESSSISAPEVAAFQTRLLVLAPGATASMFASKARRARESTFPDTLTTATKEAFTRRKMFCEEGRDGMSWLSLHLPTLAAAGIMTHCTRTARAIKNHTNTHPTPHPNPGPDPSFGNGADPSSGHGSGSGNGVGGDRGEYRTLDQLRVDVAALLLMGQELPANNYTKTGSNNTSKTSTSSNVPDWGHRGGSAGASGHCTSESSSGGSSSGFGVRLVDPEPIWTHTDPDPNTHVTTDPDPKDRDATGGDVRESCPGREADSLHNPGNPIQGYLPVQERPAAEKGAGKGLGGEGSAVDDAHPTLAQDVAGDTGVDAGDSGADTGVDVGVDVLVVGELVGDGSGFVNGVIDGIVEDQQQEYLDQLHALAQGKVITDPPLPKALILLKVPFLGLLGITDEPAELVGIGTGPIPEEIARKLMAASHTFLRVLTDPISGEALALNPDRYTLSNAEKAVLQALTGGCYIPNCPYPVMDTELDHLNAWEHGGTTAMTNLRPACARHHRLKHFKDDKDRHGNYRRYQEPHRQNIRLRGWTPQPTPDGRIGWITPSGNYQKPQHQEPQRTQYPTWLKKHINHTLNPPKENTTKHHKKRHNP
ncbi:DUF222 domain-containing protein [Arthrobacter sp. TMP15]|uniref:HNH endonuclease signature motif containing protein n=1 Tax=Arthrobacter sp. TMP15 TaxID=3140789 RepID=UPI0031BB0793